MTADVEVGRVLDTVTATLNDHRFERLDAGKVQEIAQGALGVEPAISIDDGGGIHDASPS